MLYHQAIRLMPSNLFHFNSRKVRRDAFYKQNVYVYGLEVN